MKEVRINGARMKDRGTAHTYLQLKLGLPDYYGRNLDALWDCLSTDFTPRRITIFNSATIIAQLGSYGEALLGVFQEAAAENSYLQLIVD